METVTVTMEIDSGLVNYVIVKDDVGQNDQVGSSLEVYETAPTTSEPCVRLANAGPTGSTATASS